MFAIAAYNHSSDLSNIEEKVTYCKKTTKGSGYASSGKEDCSPQAKLTSLVPTIDLT